MVQPFVEDPFRALFGVRTATLFQLDPTGTVPIAPLGSLASAVPNPARVSLDMVDSESYVSTLNVTENALQDFTSATTNAHQNLDTMSISGTLVSFLDLGPIGSIGLPNLQLFGLELLRADLERKNQILTLQKRKEPIMVVTPRRTMSSVWIDTYQEDWDPSTGENTLLTLSFTEARIVNPLFANQTIQDLATLGPGNNQATDVGPQSANPVQTQSVTPGAAPGVAPSVVPL